MQKGAYVIAENRPVARATYRLRLLGDTTALTAPGQFVNLALDGLYLRRPLSVADWDAEGMTLLYKVVGEGTRALAQYPAGKTLDLLTGLGNGFALEGSEHPLLLGGGIGTPPIYALAKAFARRGIRCTVALGFNTPEEAILVEDFQALGCTVSTAFAQQGRLVTDLLPEVLPGCDRYYACGPEPMLRAVHAACPLDGQLSFETRMACGFGACMGCSCKTQFGNKRLCKDGPVLRKEEIVW